MEGRDIFGFDKGSESAPEREEYDGPIIPIDAEVLIETLLKTDLGVKEAFSAFPDQIQWGRHPGAIQMVISPLGSFKSIVRRLQKNLVGESVWVCQRIIPYTDVMHAGFAFDENFAMDLFDEIRKIDSKEMEVPSHDYKKLENLTIRTSNYCRRKDVIPDLFIYKEIRRMVQDRNYLIKFECRGQGAEGPGSTRLEEFLIDMSYDPATGLIRSFGHDVKSTMRQHQWYPQPSEWDEYFTPSQSESEIIHAIGAALSTY
jgi:hypothetical protein